MPQRSTEERAVATIRLLWRHLAGGIPEAPKRSGVTVDAIVDAAIGIADAEGLEALSMRRIADALEVSSMTPYSYVPGKAELLDLMLDTVAARSPSTVDPGADWRTRVTAVADDNRQLCRSHPWTLHLGTSRPVLGPGLLKKYDRELGAFDGIGLGDVEMDAALTHLLGFVRESVVAERQAEAADDDARWWEAVAPVLAEVIDGSAFPLASRVGSAAGAAHGAATDPDYVYRFGLARFLDGIDARVHGKVGESTHRPDTVRREDRR
jgi:AcrR family transcriptional regulator